MQTTHDDARQAGDDAGPTIEHDFRFDRPFELAGRLFGVRPGSAKVTVSGEKLDVSFGPWHVSTTLDNVAGASVTGPYHIVKTIGPAHVSLRDRGLTFATNTERGVCIRFHQPVRGVDPLGVIKHPGLTVTVEEPEALAALLQTAGREAAEDPAGHVEVADVVADLHDDLMGLSAAELRRRVQEMGVTGVAKMSKAELVALLEEGRSEPA